MNKTGFTLLELLIVVAIIATLVGVALPYFENYVKDTKISKVRHELDVLKEALIKFDTFEDKKFTGTNTSILIGKYIQTVPNDPWGRPYEVDSSKSTIKSRGPDNIDPNDDIAIEYKPALTLQKAIWIDMDTDQKVSASDVVRLEFSRFMKPELGPIKFGITPADCDLQFSPEVIIGNFIATTTPSSLTTILLLVNSNGSTLESTFFPGSSTVRVASGNTNLLDVSGRKANGSAGEYGGMEITLQAN